MKPETKQVRIRLADIDADALSIMDGAIDFANRVSFKSLFPDNEQDFISAVGKVVSLDGMEILLAEHQGKVVGGIGILYIPYLWNTKLLVADELFWWTSTEAPFRTGLLLLDEAMSRIKEKKAVPMFRALDTSPDGVKRVYERMGMRPLETVFTF